MFGLKKKDESPDNTSVFGKLRLGLNKTRSGLFGGLNDFFAGKSKIDDSLLEDIETHMLSNTFYSGFARSFFRKRLREYNKIEKPIIEKALNKRINLNITIPKGVRI